MMAELVQTDLFLVGKYFCNHYTGERSRVGDVTIKRNLKQSTDYLLAACSAIRLFFSNIFISPKLSVHFLARNQGLIYFSEI